MSNAGRVLLVARVPESLMKRLPRPLGRVVAAHNCSEARSALSTHRDIECVITESSLTDGNWYSVLESAVENADRAKFLVTTERPSDRLREEVSSHGGDGVVTSRDLSRLASAVGEAASA